MIDTGLIYAHINKINGAMYIGQTINTIEERAGHNGIRYLECPYFGRAIKKYGWNNFDHVVLEDNVSIESLNDREQYWINKYHTYIHDPEYEKGYNVSSGGGGLHGVKISEETRLKISKSNTGKKRTEEQLETLSEAHKGNKQSEETKKKKNDKLKGKKRTEEQRKNYSDAFAKTRAVKIKCVETGVEFNNYQDAADWLGCNKCTIQNHITDPVGHKTAKGYHFIRVDNS